MSLCILQNATEILTDTSRTFISFPLKVLFSGAYATKNGDSYILVGIILHVIQNSKKMCYYANNARKTASDIHIPAHVTEELMNGYKSILQK